jgi:hypothetical protein
MAELPEPEPDGDEPEPNETLLQAAPAVALVTLVLRRSFHI